MIVEDCEQAVGEGVIDLAKADVERKDYLDEVKDETVQESVEEGLDTVAM